MNEGIIDSCAGVCLCYFRQWIEQIEKYTDTGNGKQHRNTVRKYKNTTINKEFTLSSRATSPIQLLVGAFFYCVFKVENYNEELNLSLLKQNFLAGWFLDSPSH